MIKADGSTLSYDDLYKKTEQLLGERFEKIFSDASDRYLTLSKNLRNILQDYNHKISQKENQFNVSLFLYESLASTAHLFELLENNLDKEADTKTKEEFGLILLEIFKIFELEKTDQKKGSTKPENDAGTVEKVAVSSLEKSLLNNVISVFQRKKKSTDYTGNIILSKVFAGSIEKNQDLFHGFFSCLAGLLVEIWKTSNIIHQKADGLVKADYKVPEGEDFFQFEIDFTEILKLEQEVQTSHENLIKAMRSSMKERFEELKMNAFKVADEPVERPGSFARKPTRRYLHRIFNSSRTIVRNWQNTLWLISDDWLLELEIAKLKYHILRSSFDFSKYAQSRFRVPVNENIRIAQTTIRELIDRLESKSGEAEENFVQELKAVRIDVKRKLVLKIVPEIKKIILESNIPVQIDEFEQSAAQQFSRLAQTRSIKKKAIYNEPTEPVDIDKISPFSLVSFQMMPEFMNSFLSLKQGFIRHLQEVQHRIEEIPEIVDYSLLSALSYAEENNDRKEAGKIGLEGVKRAENKIADIKSLVDHFFSNESDKLKVSIERLVTELWEITDNESALQIKIRIAKARTIETTREYRKKIIHHFKHLLPGVQKQINWFFILLRESSIRIRKQFSLEDKQRFISTDISDYLTETEKAIDKLPFIYQRLFKTESLTTFELYTERPDAIETIKTAYSRWKSGKFAPTVIIGEKGWGKTTLVNRFLKLKLTTEEVIEFHPDPDVDMDEFYQHIFSVLGPVKEEGGEEIIPNRKIIVLDGLERLFEVRIDGFNRMTSLLHHLSETNSGIFWIITCHLHAWEYLDKTLSISDYFGYHIRLADFSNEKLMKTIERRHNLSGYRLVFLPAAQKKSILSFKKQASLSDQDVLRHEYFQRMHRIVKGNLSQAFLFWMRSTSNVTEDSVFIDYQNTEYFNFLGSMTDLKLMILKYMVLQNGLSAEKYAALMRLPVAKSILYLDQLHDDGIVVKRNEVYNVNPIIYRQVIEQLFFMNILH